MNSKPIQIVSKEDTSLHGWPYSRMLQKVNEEGLGWLFSRDWAFEGVLVEGDGLELDVVVDRGQNRSGMGRCEGAWVWISVSDGQISTWIAAAERKVAIAASAKLLELFPAPKMTDEQRLPIFLWVLTPHGPRKIRRKIDVPNWPEIEANYAAGTKAQLGELVGARPAGGQILLWHGVPGTGKTFALRALAWEWRKWCDFHYVVDPEVLFGSEPGYLVQLLLDEAGDVPFGHDGRERWRLLVLEDTGEMLMPDAKQHVGQGLSRLLNVTDGILGQGLRLIILITTNEEVGRLHPAVARPGRTAARVSFEELSHNEALAWLEAHGATHVSPGQSTLAELYALAEDRLPVQEGKVVGFGR